MSSFFQFSETLEEYSLKGIYLNKKFYFKQHLFKYDCTEFDIEI